MRHSYRQGRLLGVLLLLILIPLFLRLALVRWWLVAPLVVTLLICYLVRVRRLFTILLIVAGVVVVFGFFF